MYFHASASRLTSLRVVLHILGNVGVIRRRGFNLKRLRRQQPGQPDCSRRADLHLREAFFLKILEQLEKRRKANLKSVVLREIEVGDRGEYLEPARLDESPNLRFASNISAALPRLRQVITVKSMSRRMASRIMRLMLTETPLISKNVSVSKSEFARLRRIERIREHRARQGSPSLLQKRDQVGQRNEQV